MKKTALILFVLIGLSGYVWSFAPFGYGARSLSLGYAGSAFSYDVNVIFNNPSALYTLPCPITGYQHQNSHQDYKDFTNKLTSVLEFNLSDFQSLSSAGKKEVFAVLKDMFSSKTGMYGFSANLPALAGKGYGLSWSTINSAIITPTPPEDNQFFSRNPDTVTNQDLAALKMHFMGMRAKRVTFSYGFPFAQSMTVGASAHYITGKITEFDAPITGSFFNPQWDTDQYLKETWDAAGTEFSKITVDLSFSVDIGGVFKASLVSRNLGNPKIMGPVREIVLTNRVIGALAFKPSEEWGIFLDVDIKKNDFMLNGTEMQPISLGVEKGFFKNAFFVRAGFFNDLTEKYFFGSKANVMYGLGLGFNMQNILVDLAVGLNNTGRLKSIAISGYFLIK